MERHGVASEPQYSMDARLPQDMQWRYRRRIRHHGGDRFALLLIVAAVVGFVVVVGEQVLVDLHGVVGVPASLGFSTGSDLPARGRPGFAAPLMTDGITKECDPERPTFVLGMNELKHRIGLEMGVALECEHTIKEYLRLNTFYESPPLGVPSTPSTLSRLPTM